MQGSYLIRDAYLGYKTYKSRDREFLFNDTELSTVDEMLQSVPEMKNGDG